MADLLTAVAAFIGAVCGIGSLVIARRSSIASARRDDVDALRGIIAELRARVAELEREVKEWRARYCRLAERVRSLGIPYADELPDDTS